MIFECGLVYRGSYQMLMRFPFPDSGKRGDVSSMDVSVHHPTSVLKKKRVGELASAYKRVASRLALVSIVFLVQVWSPGAAASRAFGDACAVVAAYASESVSPRMHTLRGSSNLEFAHFLGTFLMA